MYLRDRYDNQLRTGSQSARDHYVAGVDHILAGTFGAVEALEAAVADDPAFTLGHVALARARMYGGDMPGAKAAMDTAESLPAEGREISHVAAFSHLFRGDVKGARAAVEAHVAEHPRDALVAQVCTNVFGLIGFSGCAGREAQMYAFTNTLMPHYGDDWWMPSVHAQSLCEIGRVDASLELMEQALSRNPRNANAAHFKAHAQYELGETQAGLAYLSDWMDGYDKRSVIHGHLSWHVALWAMAVGDHDRLWRLVDEGVGPDGAKGLPINVLTDTAAILLRAELAGIAVSADRWAAMSDYAHQHFPNPGQSFVDIHASLAHAKAGQGDRLAIYLDQPPGFAGDLVAPTAQAWKALVAEEWPNALALLTPIMADHARLGGSRAQRDLLEFAFLYILTQLGRTDEAHRWIRSRRPALAEDAPIVGLH